MGPFLPFRNPICFQIDFSERIQQLAKFKTVSMNHFDCWLQHCPSIPNMLYHPHQIHIKSTKSTIEQCIVLKKSNYVGQCLIGPLHIAACGKSVDLPNVMVGWISFSRAATRCDLTQLSSTVSSSSDQWQENNRKKWMGRICINSVHWSCNGASDKSMYNVHGWR